MPSKTYKLGVIGHCDLGGIESQSYAQFCCHQILNKSKRKYSSLIAVSALSAGADSVFAQSAVSLGIDLQSVIPFQEFSADFTDELSSERLQFLRSHAQQETHSNFSNKSNFAYKKSMEWLVFTCNTIIAIWDGNQAGSMGGTWEAVSLSMKIQKKLIHIDNINHVMNLYLNTNNRYALHRDLTVNQIIQYL